MIEVSAGVIYNEEGSILLCQRGEGRANAHLWEFPGGKREPGEDAAACLIRELMEELSLPVTDVREDFTWDHDGIRFTFLTAKTAARPTLTEHEDARFVPPRALPRFDLCPADVVAARRLALSNVKHAIWDFDGTLLDSYPAMVRAFTAGAAELGVTVEPARVLNLMKNCLTHCCRTVSEESGVPVEELIHAFRRREADELQRGLPPMPGIPEAMKAMEAAGIRHYIATHRDLIARDLVERAGLPPFSGFVTEEDGLPRKPAPDMLLHLMARCGLDPADCLMIGDRPLDTEAGLNAGIRAVLIDPEGRFPDADCDFAVRSAEELIPLLS